MRPRCLALALCTAVALAPPSAAGQPRPSPTREQALSDLARPDADARRRAAAALGEVGAMADVPALVRALRDADRVVRALAENALWQVWSRSGDPEVDAWFELGVEQMNQRAADSAIETFTRIIRKRPEFAEGWNKRATVYFLVGEYEKSLRDCDEVMKRNPYHFGALAGYGQIYLRLGQPERAIEYFERALRVNPNLPSVDLAAEQLRQLLIERRKGTI